MLVDSCFVFFLSLQWTWGETTSYERLKDNSGYVKLQQHWDFDLWILTLLTPLLFKKRYCFQRNIVHKHNTKGAFYVLCQTLKTNKIGIQLIIKWSNTGRNWNWKGRCLRRLSVVYVHNSRKGQRWGESLLENTKFAETMNFTCLGLDALKQESSKDELTQWTPVIQKEEEHKGCTVI